MKKITCKSLFLLLALVSIFQANAKRKYVAPGFKTKQIDSLYFFEPVSLVSRISSGNGAAVNDSLSAKSQTLVKRAYDIYSKQLKLGTQIYVSDTSLSNRIQDEIFLLMTYFDSEKKPETSIHGTVLDSVMDASSKRFALLELNVGAVRTNENFKYQQRENRRVRAWSPFTSDMIYNLTQNIMYVMIIDAKEDRICFYKKDDNDQPNAPQEYSPLNFEHIKKQLHTLFEGFFFDRPSLDRG